MRAIFWLITVGCLMAAGTVSAASGRILKVLPMYLDLQGRESLSPSLYERDAYQFELRQKPDKRSGVRFAVEWKAKGPAYGPLKIRIEMHGATQGGKPQERIMEQQVSTTRWYGRWVKIDLTGLEYKEFGNIIAWRATLWEGDQQISEQKSFLW